ncbi:DEK domain-containing chromatin-associated protein 2-like [Daucus carota subsp. sativus]|uniref:DEK domain-containing chromatin-associated protein 2-like n=1 Tax=Daucus carota subsp. sativus TaxID=79200 RepID=UPI0030830B97
MASEDGSGEEDTKVADMQVENPEIEAEKEAESNPNPNHTQPDSVMADKEEAEQEEGVDKAEQDVEKDQEEQDVEKEEEKETEEAEEEKEEEETSKKGSGMKTPVSRKRRGEVKESTIERPSRERKTVERYTETSLARGSATKPFSIEKGKRMMLKDIPNVAFKLSKIKPDDNLQLLHNILFGKRMKVHTLKKNIGLFSGFVWAENEV